MNQSSIVPLGDSAAIVLTAEVLRELKLQVGDSVQLTLSHGNLIVSPAQEVERDTLVDQLSDTLLQRRADAYRRLA